MLNLNPPNFTPEEWKNSRDIELAKLYFYSFTYHNKDLADNTIKSWIKNYNDLNSLFYIGGDREALWIHGILGIDFKPSLLEFKQLENEGLTNYPSSILYKTMSYDSELFKYVLEKSKESFYDIVKIYLNFNKNLAKEEIFNTFYTFFDLSNSEEKRNIFLPQLLISCLIFDNEHIFLEKAKKYNFNINDVCNNTEIFLEANPVRYMTKNRAMDNEYLKHKMLHLIYQQLQVNIPEKEFKAKIKL